MAKKTTKKKKTKEVAKKEEPLFIRLPEPENIQRHILESTRESLLILKKLEELKKIRLQKMESVDVLASLIAEIKSLIIKLKKKIPIQVTKKLIKEEKTSIYQKEEKIKNEDIQSMTKPKKPSSELEKLEAELSAIESRLKRV